MLHSTVNIRAEQTYPLHASFATVCHENIDTGLYANLFIHTWFDVSGDL